MSYESYEWTTYTRTDGSTWQQRKVHGCTIYRDAQEVRTVVCAGYAGVPGDAPSVSLQIDVVGDEAADAVAELLSAARDAALTALRKVASGGDSNHEVRLVAGGAR